MNRKIKKYNPGFLTDQEIVDSFCVRTCEFALLTEALRESTGNSNSHTLVVGPRGSGKTTLLLRVAVEVRRDAALNAAWFPVVFAEENYEVSTCGEFWLQCLINLADQALPNETGPDLERAFEEMRAINDDRTLADRCLAAILDFADSEGKRLVLMVENLNTLFDDIGDPDVGWQLRKTLQCEPRIFLMGSATSRFEEIDNSDRALYDLFQVYTLKRLDTESCAVLWRSVSKRNVNTRAIRSIEILTGGNPRLVAIIAEFGSRLSFQELMNNLLSLVDDHTEYFRSHLESLGVQDRRIYLALARLWKPATAREVTAISRFGTSHCSAILKRLVNRGAVICSGGVPRRREYYLAERMYNIYYLLRSGRGRNQVVEALIQFMTGFYSPPELADIREQIRRDAKGDYGALDAMTEVARKRIEDLLSDWPAGSISTSETAELRATHGADRETSRSKITVTAAQGVIGEADEPFDSRELKAGDLLTKAEQLFKNRLYDRAIAALEEIEVLLAEVDTPDAVRHRVNALLGKSAALARTGRLEEALRVCDEVLRLSSLRLANRPEEASDAIDDFSDRFRGNHSDWIRRLVHYTLLKKAKAELRAGQPGAAIFTANRVLQEPCSHLSDSLVLAHLLRAEGYFACQNQSGCESELASMLKLLPRFETIPATSIQGLIEFTIRLGPERVLGLIEGSPATSRLFPLMTALREEIGIETKVATEVAEVAKDIREALASAVGRDRAHSR